MYRSTKGASKARRDQINTEIRNLKDLLPITDTDKARLSYLHIMSLACMYTRKSLFFSQDTARDQSSGFMSFHELSELIHELAGFMVVVTGEGKLLHLSENVVDHLGLCMVDLVAQSDSVYDIVDPSDHFVMRSSLAPSVTGDADRLFRCHFNTSKFLRRQGSGNKAMLVRARCLPPPSPGSSHSTSTPVWVCFCTPLRLKPSAHTPPLTPPPEHSFLLASFHSQHLRDMTVWDVHNSVTMYLGYDVEALRSRSWYSLLHPRDLSHASTQHCALLSEGGDKQVDMVVQVETADHSWVWLYMVLQMGAGEHPITCNNYVISESEAWSLRQQLSVEQQSHSSGYYSSGDCMHRQSSLSSPDQVFTPSSSGLSAQSFDFSAAPSGSSFSDEAMQPSEQHPRSSLSSLEEESLTHGRQQWYSERSGPAPISPPVSLTESDFLNQRVPSHSVGLSDPVSPSLTEYLTPVSMPLTHQMGEFACTPPYTPQLSRGFSFGERLHLSLDLTNTVASSTCQKLHTFAGADRTHSFSGSISSEEATLMLPRGYYRASDGFSEGECNTMSVSEIWGSLYVDVAQKPMNGHPHGLLTPENSPTQHPGSFLFSSAVEQEKEREEISTLARYLSSLAESFSCKSLIPKQPLSFLPPSPSPPPKSQSQNSVCENKLHPWMATEQSHQRDVSLYEENALLEILYEDLASFPSSPSSPSSYSTASPSTSSSPCSPQTPTSRDYSIGVDHFSSVQSTRCNCMAVDGATMATGAATTTTIQETAEDVMMMDTSELPSSASLAASLEPVSLEPASQEPASQEPASQEPASQEPASILGHSAPPHTVPHDRFLMQELVAMDQVFEADAYISSFWGNSLSCINSHSTTMASRSFHQGGSLRDPAF